MSRSLTREPQTVPLRATPAHGSVSVVIPVFNERGTLEELHDQLSGVLREVAASHEILFIDDGSTDGSQELLQDLAAGDANVRVYSFRSNRGKAAALSLGFAEARGDFVVTMDADLQDQPSELPKLLDKLDEYDLVSGWKRTRHDPLSKTLPSKIFNKITALVSGIPIHDFNCGYKAYRSAVVQELDLYGEMHRFIPVLAAGNGFKVGEAAVEHSPRTWGESKYGASRLFKGAYDLLTVILLTRFEHRPMHFFGSMGLLLGAGGFLVLLYMSYLRLVLDEVIGNRPLLFLGIVLLLAGLQLVSTGLVGELIVRRTRKKHIRGELLAAQPGGSEAGSVQDG